jgi:hypothetical protein
MTLTASAKGAPEFAGLPRRVFHMLGNLFISWTQNCVRGRID